MSKIAKNIVLVLVCSLISYYLTLTIDKTTLETRWRFAFVFVYFLVSNILIYKIFLNRIQNRNKKNSIFRLIASGILAVLLLVCCFDSFIGLYKPMTIRITAVGNNEGLKEGQRGTEVWLKQVMIDNEQVDLSEVPLTDGWEYRDGFLLSYQDQPNSIILHLPAAKSVKLKFLSHPWSGMVVIDNGYECKRIDLFNPDMEGTNIEIPIEGIQKTFQGVADVLQILSCYVFLCYILYILFALWDKSVIPAKNLNVSGISLLLLFLYIILFLFSSNISFGVSTRFSILLATIAVTFILPEAINWARNQLNPGSIILLLFTILYSTFALVGHQLFLSGSFVEINISNILRFILCMMFFTPHVLSVIYLIDKYTNKPLNCVIPSHRDCILFRLYLGVTIFIILIILTLPFYPGNITSDGVDIWAQAKGVRQLNDAHPAMYTLITRLTSAIWDTPYTMVILSSIIFAFVVSGIVTLQYKKGYSKKYLFIAPVFISVLPNTYMMMSLVSKNILFAVILLWLTYLIMKMFEEKAAFFKSVPSIISFVICNVLLVQIRHNGFVIIFITGLILTYYTIRYWKGTKIVPVLILISVIACNSITNYIIYNNLDVQKSDIGSRGMNGPLLSPFGAALKYGKELPSETIEILENVAPLQQWKDYYNPYLIDTFSFSSPTPQYQNVSTKEAFNIYLQALWQYPDIVIKDRFDNANLVWNIVEPRNVPNSRYAVGIWPPPTADTTEETIPQILQADKKQPNGSYYKVNHFSKVLTWIASISARIEIVDIFLWRNGIYLVLTLILFTYLVITKNKKYMFILMPAIAIICSYILAMGFQIYQYLWFNPLAYIFSFVFILSDIRAANMDKSKKMV